MTYTTYITEICILDVDGDIAAKIESEDVCAKVQVCDVLTSEEDWAKLAAAIREAIKRICSEGDAC